MAVPKMAKAIEYGDLEFGTERVGVGGSATVYKGRWKSMDMIVAVKTSVQGIPQSEVCLAHTMHVFIQIIPGSNVLIIQL